MIPEFRTFSNSVENPIVSLLEKYRGSEFPNHDELSKSVSLRGSKNNIRTLCKQGRKE